MREYRTRLFADVVTGQLDVRGSVAQLPEEETEAVEEDEIDDEGLSEEDVGEEDTKTGGEES